MVVITNFAFGEWPRVPAVGKPGLQDQLAKLVDTGLGGLGTRSYSCCLHEFMATDLQIPARLPVWTVEQPDKVPVSMPNAAPAITQPAEKHAYRSLFERTAARPAPT